MACSVIWLILREAASRGPSLLTDILLIIFSAQNHEETFHQNIIEWSVSPVQTHSN